MTGQLPAASREIDRLNDIFARQRAACNDNPAPGLDQRRRHLLAFSS